MKTIRRILADTTVLAFAVVLTGCATAPPTIQAGPNAEVSFDGLHKVDHSKADMAWARPDFDVSGYTKILLVNSGIEYAPAENMARTAMERSRGGPYFIDDDQRARFEKEVHDVFQEELQKVENYEFVTETGPDVMILRAAILDVESSLPGDPNDTIGRSSVYLSSVGEATLVLELRDSETGAILARSIDRRAAESGGGMAFESNRVTNRSEVRRLLRLWGSRLRESLIEFGA